MSSVHQNLSSNKMVNASSLDHFSFTIITAEWNNSITFTLEAGCINTLKQNSVIDDNIRVIRVPGSWELISAARWATQRHQNGAVICIGAVIKGDTPHFEYICQGLTSGLAQLNTQQDIPVIYGVLTVNTMEQAEERCGGKHGNKGDEAAFTAIKMALLREELNSSSFYNT
jgi:6,7-dimethyl-8-ribityllumazine synthase